MFVDLMKRNGLHMFDADTGGGTGVAGGDGAPTDPTSGDDTGGGDQGGSDKTFTRDELAKITSGQVKQALDSFKQNDLPDILKAKYEEGKNDAGLTDEERAAKQESDRDKALDEREAKLNARENLAATQKLLTDKGLPTEFAKYLTGKDDTERAQNVQTFSDAISKLVQAEVLKKTAGGREPTGGSTVSHDDKVGSFGKRMAELSKQNGVTKSNYFG